MSKQNNQINDHTIYELLATVDGLERQQISSLIVKEKHIGFAITVKEEQAKTFEPIRKDCATLLEDAYPGFQVTVVLTTESNNPVQSPPISEKRAITGAKKVLLVASGKGGVGKSTMSVHLALAMQRVGKRVAIVDADIYGPSIPKMMGLKGKPEITEQQKMVPLVAHNIQVNSIGFLIDEGKSTIWRGPMATKALYQLLIGTAWDNVDVLIVDMPPGTGDIQLTIAKNFIVDGVVLVSTPQEVALLDVAKAYDMFRIVEIPVLGLIENMSYLEDASSGKKHYVFGQGNVEKFAKKNDIPYLTEVPIQTQIAKSGDKGLPIDANNVIQEAQIQKILAALN